MANNLIDYEWTAVENLKMLYPSADILRERARILEDYKLNVFDSAQTMPNWHSLKRMQGGIMAIDSVGERLYAQESSSVSVSKATEEFINLNGWAADDQSKDGTVNTYLIFSDREKEIIIPTKKTQRSDVAKYFGVESYVQSGWSATIRSKEFKDKCYNISLRILRANGKEYYELNGNKSVCFS